MLGIGALLLGLVLMIIWNVIAPAFFRGETLGKRDSGDLVLQNIQTEHVIVGLPGSGLPDLVIAPDLSNLPQGEAAMDLETGVSVDDTGELRALRDLPESPKTPDDPSAP